MSLKLERVLSKSIKTKIIQEAINTDGIFDDYTPIIFFSEPREVKFKIENEEVNGKLTLLSSDVDKLISGVGKKLGVYNFILNTGNEEMDLKIGGNEINNEKFGAPSIIKGQPYNIITDDKTSGETPNEEEGKSQSLDIDEKEFDKIDSDLRKLKSSASKLSSLKLSRRSSNVDFRKALILNLINSEKTNIKVNGESINNLLKKLYDDKLLEEPNKNPSWEVVISDFIKNLLQTFSNLNQCCKDNETYIEIKNFFKKLYIVIASGKANYKDENRRNQIFEGIVKNLDNILKYLNKGVSFTNKEQQVENFIFEVETKSQIVFTEINLKTEDIEGNIDKFEDEVGMEDENNDGKDDDGKLKMSPEDVQKLGLTLYGKNAGKLFPRGGLFKGLKSATDSIKDRYGIYDLSYAQSGEDSTSKTFENTPKYVLKFISNVNYRGDGDTFVKIKKGDDVIFNYDKESKTLIHKTTRKKYMNVSQIVIKMDSEPEIGETYDSKIIKMIPLKGKTIETQPNYRVKFTIQEPPNNKNK